MPKFKKPIVTSGVFLVGNDKGGRHHEVIDEGRLRHWAKTANKMHSKGILIPGPWAHSNEALPVQMGQDGTVKRSDLNAGFWSEFVVEANEDGIPTLFGTIEVPGDPNDPNTPAGKVGKSVKETSIYTRPTFQDGTGEVHKDALMHVALVTHPIEPNQKNFELVPEDGLVIAMSHLSYALGTKMSSHTGMDDYDNPGEPKKEVTGNAEDLNALLELLRQSGIDLPEDTSEENFKDRLFVALRQKSASESEEDEDEGSLRKPPEEAEEDSVPAVMSQTTPKTPEVTAEVIMAHPAYTALADQNKQLFAALNTQARNARGTRINALIKSGRISKEYADANLVPMLNAFKMSFGEDGNEQVSPLDMTLNALEAMPAPRAATPANPQANGYANAAIQQLAPFLMSSIAPEGSDVPSHGLAGFDGTDLSEETLNKVADDVLANVGL